MLDPAVCAHLEATTGASREATDQAQLRAEASREIDDIFSTFGLRGPSVERIRDAQIPVRGGTMLVRTYHPVVGTELPAHIYLHGGGWTTGSIDELVCDATARHRSVSAGCVTVLVDYRLAPEFPFPTAIHDVIAAIRWVHDHAAELGVDRRVITLGGSSAGANLATAAVLADPQLGIRGLLLEVPALDLRHGGSLPPPDDIDPSDAKWIEPMRDAYQQAVAQYLPDPDSAHTPLATPLVAPDLSNVPETHILTAELDMLRPGAELFAARLDAAGVSTHITCYPGALHGSPILNAVWPTARRWHDDSLAILRCLNSQDLTDAT